MSREAWGDPPDPEPQRCPVCDGEWHAEGCELGEEVSRRLKAETEARTLRCRYAVVSGWIVEALKGKLRNASMDERNRLEHYAGPALDEALDALPAVRAA